MSRLSNGADRPERRRGLALPPDMVAEVQHQLDIRAWLLRDWAEAAGLEERTARRYLDGERIERTNAAALWRALEAHEPIKGLAEVLERTQL